MAETMSVSFMGQFLTSVCCAQLDRQSHLHGCDFFNPKGARRPRGNDVSMRVLRRLICVVVSPKVDDCTRASVAVKPPANNHGDKFFWHAKIAKILRENQAIGE
jgi:hypothetical protein